MWYFVLEWHVSLFLNVLPFVAAICNFVYYCRHEGSRMVHRGNLQWESFQQTQVLFVLSVQLQREIFTWSWAWWRTTWISLIIVIVYVNPYAGEWKRMSLPAMLVGETVGEILQASQFAREIVSAVGKKTVPDDPKTPMSERSNKKVELENTQLRIRRKKEKQTRAQNDGTPPLQRARSRINFKVSPPKVREFDKESNRYMANRVSPRNRPWARKTVLFPNPLFLSTHSSSQSQQQQFCKTRSPIISRNRATTSHKFLIKSPPSPPQKQQQSCKTKSPGVSRNRGGTPHKFLIKSPSSASKGPPTLSISPTRPVRLSRLSPPKRPSSSSTASKFRRSFSPSRIASRLVSLSPLRSRKTVQKNDGIVSGLKQRPASSMQFPVRGI